MPSTYRQFLIELYVEHLEDGGFLHEQRKALLLDHETAWTRLDDVEARIEAHIDALMVGGELALQLCRERLKEAEPGELFVAVCVFCRRQDARLLADVWRSLAFDDAAKVAAVTDALKLEMPSAWQPACEQAITRGDERLLPILAAVCGSRRMPLAEAITARITSKPQLINVPIVAALSRLRLSATALKTLQACGQHATDEVKAALLMLLLRNGQHNALKPNYLSAQSEDWPLLALGLAGDRSAAAVLRQRLKSAVVKPETLYAVGLLGDLSSVRALCDCLTNEQLAETASWALHWITGAALFEGTFVPETVDESTLFPKELKAWQERGEAPKRADGNPFGTVVHQLTQDASTWNRWLSEHADKFDPNVRYRRGAVYSLRSVYSCLVDPSVPHLLRQLTYEELVIRFACPVPFEAEWRVAEQRAALEDMEQWVQQTELQFASGHW